MKIAFIYDAVYPWIKGGVEKRVYEIARRLVKRGHEVHYFGLKWWNGEKELEKDGIVLHGVGKWDNLYEGDKRSVKEALYFGLKVLTELGGNFDIIDCQEFPYFSCFSAKLRSSLNNSKFFITWYEVWGNYWFTYLGKEGIFGWIVERLTAKLPHLAIAISDKIKNDLIKLMGMSENKIRVVPNGVDFYRIQKVNKGEGFDVIYVGRLVPHKNVDVLLKAMAQVRKELPNVTCGIIGDGPQMIYLKVLAKQLGIEKNVKFFGFIESDEMLYSYMKSSKLFILPSTREGFPNVLLEANACGLPIIVIRHEKNNATALVKNGYNGFILNLSPHVIAEKIIYLLQNEDKLRQLSKNAMEYAKTYDWNIIVEKLIKVYGGS